MIVIESTLSLNCTIGMRLGRFMDFSKTILRSFRIPNRRLGTIAGLIATCQGLFMLLDNILLLNRYKVLHLSRPDRIQKMLNQVWLLWISLALTRDYYQIQAKLAISQHGLSKQDRSLTRPGHVFWTDKTLLIDVIKNLCDLYLPLSNLNYVTPSPAVQGIAGTISSILGLLQIWDTRYALNA